MDKPEIRNEAELRAELAKVDAEIARLEAMIAGVQGARQALRFALGEGPLFVEQKPAEA